MHKWLRKSVDWLNLKIDAIDDWTIQRVNAVEDFFKGEGLTPKKYKDYPGKIAAREQKKINGHNHAQAKHDDKKPMS